MRLTPVILLAVACGVQDSTQTDTNAHDWGVQEGATITQAAPGDLNLTLDRALVGSIMRAEVSDAYAYEDFQLIISMAGEGASCPAPLGGGCLGLNAPSNRVASGYADDSGAATIDVPVPMLPRFVGSEVCGQLVANRGPAGWVTSNVSCVIIDADTDGDGLADSEEDAIGTDRYNPDTDGDGALDGFDCAPLDPTKFDACGVLYGSQSRSCGTTEVYTIDPQAGTYSLAWNNGTKYTALAGFDDRLFGGVSGFDGNMHEINPADGSILDTYYQGSYQPAMTATPSGEIQMVWGCQQYVFDGNNLSAGGVYTGGMYCNNMDLAVDDAGNTYYVDDGDFGTIDFSTGAYGDVGVTSGWESGGVGYRDKVSAFEYHQGTFYVVNTSWMGAVTDLFEFDPATGAVTYVMELPACIDGLGSTY
ncbi:MAG: hypothetical protein ACI8PZ_005632 [Myxococcota bacterium]|jgi:hypothetical protein